MPILKPIVLLRVYYMKISTPPNEKWAITVNVGAKIQATTLWIF